MVDVDDFSFESKTNGSQLLSGSGRLRRSAAVARLIDERSLYCFQDGQLSQLMLREVLESYVAGHFVSTIIIGFSFIERSIAGRLNHVGMSAAAKQRSEQLLQEALKLGWLSANELRDLEALRGVRNQLVHFKEPLSINRPEIRALLEARSLDELVERQAKSVVEAAVHVLDSTAF